MDRLVGRWSREAFRASIITLLVPGAALAATVVVGLGGGVGGISSLGQLFSGPAEPLPAAAGGRSASREVAEAVRPGISGGLAAPGGAGTGARAGNGNASAGDGSNGPGGSSGGTSRPGSGSVPGSSSPGGSANPPSGGGSSGAGGATLEPPKTHSPDLVHQVQRTIETGVTRHAPDSIRNAGNAVIDGLVDAAETLLGPGPRRRAATP
jgi:hypothetical protein